LNAQIIETLFGDLSIPSGFSFQNDKCQAPSLARTGFLLLLLFNSTLQGTWTGHHPQ
jgi:hypothetical protein